MIKDFQPRIYQETILSTASQKNTLVVIPTGLGKTYIFLLLAAQRLSKFPHSKILFLGPTRPLISQYFELFLKHFEIKKEEMALFTGMVKPGIRMENWKTSKIIFSTPQGLENDIISEKIDLSDVSLLGIDEAHRAVGDYSYVWIAQQYMKKAKNPRLLALTASPGSDMEKISEVCRNLHIEDVEVRTDEDPDVKPYLQDVQIKWIYVDLPDYFRSVQKYLKDCYNSKIAVLKELVKANQQLDTKRELLALQHELLIHMKEFRDLESMKAISVLAEAMKVEHAIELLESQGVTPLNDYLENLVTQAAATKTKAVQNLARDLNFKSALVLARNLKSSGIEHPKYEELKKILQKYSQKTDFKIIIFSQYRDSISSLLNIINKQEGIKAEMFVGQAKKKDTGMSQKKQIEMIEKFKTNDVNVLVMSSVGEEGLDIPSVDCVIFYEPVPSAIRTIQRRGRTGRQSAGEVFVLVAKGTRDEAYRWTAYHKEKRMNQILLDLKSKFSIKKSVDRPLSEFILPEEGITICADHREKASGVIKKLHELGIKINLMQLEVGDYLLSDNVCVEFKTVPDFVDSLLDKRIFSQLKSMQKYGRQLVVIEGTEDIYSQRNLHPNAIRGMLAAITVDYGVPILTTKNSDETAMLLAVIAKREQSVDKNDFTLHSHKPLTLKEQQEYIISALPGVGPVLSKPLLQKFGSVRNIINATEAELKEVDLIGDKKAAKIKEIVDSKY
ncbi:MAG: DEAD/DEAH box helicase [archaeon]